jgi:DNA damage-binding protein 1
MSYSYIATSQKSTAVNCAVVCNFVSVDQKSLIVAKGNNLTVYNIANDELVVESDTHLLGKIKTLDYYRPANSTLDVVFVLTDSNFCVLAYDPAEPHKLATRAVGNIKDRAGRDVEIGQRGFLDPDSRMIGMMLYEGQLKVRIILRILRVVGLRGLFFFFSCFQ